MELLGSFYPNMVVEVVGHYWRFSGHWSVGPQSPVQVESCVDLLQVVVVVCRKVDFHILPPQDGRGDMCGVQSHADRCGTPCLVIDVRGVGMRPRDTGKLLLAPCVHATLLRLTSLCSSLCLGLQTRPLPRGKNKNFYYTLTRYECAFFSLKEFRQREDNVYTKKRKLVYKKKRELKQQHVYYDFLHF